MYAVYAIIFSGLAAFSDTYQYPFDFSQTQVSGKRQIVQTKCIFSHLRHNCGPISPRNYDAAYLPQTFNTPFSNWRFNFGSNGWKNDVRKKMSPHPVQGDRIDYYQPPSQQFLQPESWKKRLNFQDIPRNFSIFEDATYIQNYTAGYETDKYCVYDLRMTYFHGSPDGVKKRIIGFNQQFPGPTLYCTKGKTMVIRVTNDIDDATEPTSIHWHGIQQTLTPFYDGPQSVTQCPIIRDTSMIYKFEVFQAGTYWYHSHHSYQYVDGAWGFLIVRNTPIETWQNSYDDERLISINDWIHLPAKIIIERYMNLDVPPNVNSSLINGRGTFNCSKALPGEICNPAIQGPSVVDVTQGKRYRFRILNSSGLEAYNFSIDSHKFVVIETDGVDTVKSPKVDVVTIYAAQRYSIIVIMDQPLGEYWIRITGFPGVAPGVIGQAILRYSPNLLAPIAAEEPLLELEPANPVPGFEQGRPVVRDIPYDEISRSGGIQVPELQDLKVYFPFRPPKFSSNLQETLDLEHAQMVANIRLPTNSPVNSSSGILLDQNLIPPLESPGVNGSAPIYFDRLFIINTTDCPIPGSPARMCMNGEPYIPGNTTSPPILYQVIQGFPIPSSARPAYTLGDNEVIRLVIINNHRIPHPWHLHGHSFWVLGTGDRNAGDYDILRDASKLTLKGVRRDTTHNLPFSWSVITYIANNPGTWFFHCHINWHLELGLGMTFIENEKLSREIYKYPPPESTKTCARVGVSII